MNDISAACAGASFVPHERQPAPGHTSIEERLSKLIELRSQGLISDQEYDSARQKIIDEV